MQAPAVKDKVISSKTTGPMGSTQTHASNKSNAAAPQFSGAKPGEASYERMSALNKTKAQDAFPGDDKAMPVIKSVLGQA